MPIGQDLAGHRSNTSGKAKRRADVGREGHQELSSCRSERDPSASPRDKQPLQRFAFGIGDLVHEQQTTVAERRIVRGQMPWRLPSNHDARAERILYPPAVRTFSAIPRRSRDRLLVHRTSAITKAIALPRRSPTIPFSLSTVVAAVESSYSSTSDMTLQGISTIRPHHGSPLKKCAS